MAKKRTDVLVVPHTHWDRAWYWPLERFRVKLIHCVKRVIEELKAHENYRFTLDGQVLPLSDYLEAHPRDGAFLKRMIRRGRLKVGPMYCLADLYCTGGEALIRNLLIGRAISGRFGGSQDELHMPDTFGITPSVPLIAAGFGLDTFTFMRGVVGEAGTDKGTHAIRTDIQPQLPAGTRMFHWAAPDGSAIRVMRLRDGYANAATRLGHVPGTGLEPRYDRESYVEGIIAAAQKQDDGQGEPLLLMAGVDHQIPHPDLAYALPDATKRSHYRFRFADFDDLAAVMRDRDASDWPSYTGEFHGSGAASVLGGTISARIYLKQTNAEVERLLVHQAEAATAFAAMLGVDDPAAASIELAWKHLLSTHPHDDICGCSVDTVHRDNEHMMRQARDAGDAVRRQMVRRIVETVGGNRPGDDRFSFLLINTQPTARRARLRLRCDFEGRERFGDWTPPERYAVVDETGAEAPFVELERGRWVEHPHPTLLIELDAPLKPMSVQRFYLEPRAQWPRTGQDEAAIENDRLRVEPERDGSFTLTDKRTGQRFEDCGVFSDQADVGDTYDFADLPAERERLFRAGSFRVEQGHGCSGLQRLVMRGELAVPAASDESGRSEREVELPVEVVLSLTDEADQVEVDVRFENTARDHRLRWNLLLPSRGHASRAGLKFNEVSRPAGKQPPRRVPRDAKAARVHPIHPADHYAAVAGPDGGLAVFGAFPFNYELVRGGRGERDRLAVTLLRAVGQLSKSGMSTRRGGAGPDTRTPEAQCLGRRFAMRFAVRPFAGEEAGGLFAESIGWRTPPIKGQIEPWYPRRAAAGEPVEGPLLEADPPVVVSAFKPAQQGRGVIVRLFNPTGETIASTLRLRSVKRIEPVDLAERPTEGFRIERAGRGAWTVNLPPYAPRSLRIADRAPWRPAASRPPTVGSAGD